MGEAGAPAHEREIDVFVSRAGADAEFAALSAAGNPTFRWLNACLATSSQPARHLPRHRLSEVSCVIR
ncbi:hypothetical protein HQ394_01580 [Defluviicoccus vanus]|uniref:Uncharacterized protein n=1 Tax=Defluviicoccus vanus TaxID=111831 RepID=A0A7H1MXV4_9PROT|nr:hypothetical protein HQ394_01580 [Defluviicoccus vanus]